MRRKKMALLANNDRQSRLEKLEEDLKNDTRYNAPFEANEQF